MRRVAMVLGGICCSVALLSAGGCFVRARSARPPNDRAADAACRDESGHRAAPVPTDSRQRSAPAARCAPQRKRQNRGRQLQPSRGTIGVDVLGVAQLGPSLDLELTVAPGMSVGLSGRLTGGGAFSHYIPDLYPGEGRLLGSYQVGTTFRYYPFGGRYHRLAGFFFGGLVEYFRYKFENGRNLTYSPAEIQTVDMIILGVEVGQRWDFRNRFFVTLHGAVGVPIVAKFSVVDDFGETVTTDPKDAASVPPVAFRLSLSLGVLF